MGCCGSKDADSVSTDVDTTKETPRTVGRETDEPAHPVAEKDASPEAADPSRTKDMVAKEQASHAVKDTKHVDPPPEVSPSVSHKPKLFLHVNNCLSRAVHWVVLEGKLDIDLAVVSGSETCPRDITEEIVARSSMSSPAPPRPLVASHFPILAGSELVVGAQAVLQALLAVEPNTHAGFPCINPDVRRRFLPDGVQELALVDQLVCWVVGKLAVAVEVDYAFCDKLVTQHLTSPKQWKSRSEIVSRSHRVVKALLDIWEEHFAAKGAYFGQRSERSLADVMAVCALASLERWSGPVAGDLSQYSRISEWHQRMKALPVYKRVNKDWVVARSTSAAAPVCVLYGAPPPWIPVDAWVVQTLCLWYHVPLEVRLSADDRTDSVGSWVATSPADQQAGMSTMCTPTLVMAQSQVLCELPTILKHLAVELQSPWYPKSRRARAVVDQVMCWTHAKLYPTVRELYELSDARFSPSFSREAREVVRGRTEKLLNSLLLLVNGNLLSRGRFLCGSFFSLADLYLMGICRLLECMQLMNWGSHSRIKEWNDEVSKLAVAAAFRKSYEMHPLT